MTRILYLICEFMKLEVEQQMKKAIAVITFIILFIFVLTGCDEQNCENGEEGCKCIQENSEIFEGGFCQPGLECFKDRCVRPWGSHKSDDSYDAPTDLSHIEQVSK